MFTKDTELCEVYNATINESRVRIEQIEKALLPVTPEVDQMNETSAAGARPDAFEQAQLVVLGVEEIFGDEGSGSGSASASFAGPASTVAGDPVISPVDADAVVGKA